MEIGTKKKNPVANNKSSANAAGHWTPLQFYYCLFCIAILSSFFSLVNKYLLVNFAILIYQMHSSLCLSLPMLPNVLAGR